jgi:hypothetical protein
MRLRRLGFLCAVGAVVFSGCNSSQNLLTTTTNTSAVRFLNGSPDLGNVDVYTTTATGTPVAAALAYATLNSYADLTSKAYTFIVTAAGSPSTQKLTCALSALGANTRYTIVIAGKVAAGTAATGLQCQVFAETVYSLPASQFQMGFHHASPALNAAANATVSFGLYSAGLNNYQLPSGLATFQSTLTSGTGIGTAVNVLLPAVQTAPGLGVYVSAQTGSPPASALATTTPSQATVGLSPATGAENTNNFMPYTTTSGTTTTTVSSNLSVYAIDSNTNASGVQLVCAMD